jgi:hypothetical protein
VKRRPKNSPTSATITLRALLCGGDRRSVAKSDAARIWVGASPPRIKALAQLTHDADWLVAMRALDLLEKLAHERPELVQPHRRVFIGPLADSEQWENHLQIVRALPLLRWAPAEQRRVVAILRRDVEHPQKFVKAWALDGLARLAVVQPGLRSQVERLVAAFARSGSKALATRARHIKEFLAAGTRA